LAFGCEVDDEEAAVVVVAVVFSAAAAADFFGDDAFADFEPLSLDDGGVEDSTGVSGACNIFRAFAAAFGRTAVSGVTIADNDTDGPPDFAAEDGVGWLDVTAGVAAALGFFIMEKKLEMDRCPAIGPFFEDDFFLPAGLATEDMVVRTNG